MYKNILATIDFESNSEIIISHVEALAIRFNAKVWLVHIAAPEPDFVGYGVGPKYIRDARADELRDEHRKIQQLTEIIEDKGIEVEGLLIEGVTTDMIVEECKKLNIDLICIGHRKHNWLHTLLESHTDFSIIEKVKIPVLSIPLED